MEIQLKQGQKSGGKVDIEDGGGGGGGGGMEMVNNNYIKSGLKWWMRAQKARPFLHDEVMLVTLTLL